MILCLPDDAAREAIRLISSNHVRVLDASTAHRVADGWIYGLPELDAHQRERIRGAARVSNPGCYPTGFVLPHPPPRRRRNRVRRRAFVVPCGFGILRRRAPAHRALRGARRRAPGIALARPTVCAQPGPQAPAGDGALLRNRPGRRCSRPWSDTSSRGCSPWCRCTRIRWGRAPTSRRCTRVWRRGIAKSRASRCFHWGAGDALDSGFLDPLSANGTNRIDLFVYGHEAQVMLVARLDNLGKGASGVAVQNLNIMTGAEELAGLLL